jgi:hypothetical protein
MIECDLKSDPLTPYFSLGIYFVDDSSRRTSHAAKKINLAVRNSLSVPYYLFCIQT